MRVDLLIAATSAGLLVYSGRLLVPTARFRPEDIIPDTSAGPSDPFGAGMAPWSVFPENNIVIRIRASMTTVAASATMRVLQSRLKRLHLGNVFRHVCNVPLDC